VLADYNNQWWHYDSAYDVIAPIFGKERRTVFVRFNKANQAIFNPILELINSQYQVIYS
jgi:hypothetical protein